ncbi:serine/threonine-protein kinase [Kitasatospora sp. NPDC054939]
MQALESDDPRQVGGYRLLRRLGAGGMGRVYLGRTAGGRTVAVKVVRGELAEDPEFRARFRQEVAAARRVGGAWTAPVLDADTEGPHPWVATGYVAGPALGAAVQTFGPLPEPAVRALGIGLAQALEHVHGLGLVHRDVKPSNVLLTLDGPRLIDFGITRALDVTSALTRSGYVVGSPGFMSPEQAQGRTAGPPSDVFSLGAVLAHAAGGVQPFGEGLGAAVLLYRVLHEEPDLSGVGGPLRGIVRECLAKDPADRPTPARLSDLLDPDGSVAALLGAQGGWLPPALAAAVGRSAVELLDLEAEAGAGPGAGSWPGAGGASWPGAGGFGVGAGGPEGSTGGGFGPGTTERVAAARSGPGPDAASGSGASGAGASGSGSGAFGPVGANGAATGPVDVRTAPTGRRAGRTRAAVAAVLAAAVLGLGGWGLYAWLGPDGRHDEARDTGGTYTAAPPAGTGSPTAGGTATAGTATGGTATGTTGGTPTGGSGTVPAAFLGTWRGTMTTQSGNPGGTTTVVIGAATVGQENTTSRNQSVGLPIEITCQGAWTLRSATDTELVFTSRLTASSIAGVCTGGSNEERLALQKDGTIRFSSIDPLAGNPTGTLSKVG